MFISPYLGHAPHFMCSHVLRFLTLYIETWGNPFLYYRRIQGIGRWHNFLWSVKALNAEGGLKSGPVKNQQTKISLWITCEKLELVLSQSLLTRMSTTKSTTYSRHGSDEVEQVPLEIFSAATNDSTANHHMQNVSAKSSKTLSSHVAQDQGGGKIFQKVEQWKQQHPIATIQALKDSMAKWPLAYESPSTFLPVLTKAIRGLIMGGLKKDSNDQPRSTGTVPWIGNISHASLGQAKCLLLTSGWEKELTFSLLLSDLTHIMRFAFGAFLVAFHAELPPHFLYKI